MPFIGHIRLTTGLRKWKIAAPDRNDGDFIKTDIGDVAQLVRARHS
jgi:hypothetical protein